MFSKSISTKLNKIISAFAKNVPALRLGTIEIPEYQKLQVCVLIQLLMKKCLAINHKIGITKL